MNGAVFDKDIMTLPVIYANTALVELFESHTKEVLSQIRFNSFYTRQVSNLLVDRIKGELPTLAVIAKELGMSVRSLQMKLKQEDTSFRDLLNEVRKNFALTYLKRKDLSIASIAYLLGFSEPCVFQRTFKRWTGSTPGEFRKKQA